MDVSTTDEFPIGAPASRHLRTPVDLRTAVPDARRATVVPSANGPATRRSHNTSDPQVLRRRVRRFLGGIRAWMVVLPTDAVLLWMPALWTPQQIRAHTALALLSLALVTNGGRYRARLHLSMLDELPSLLGKLLTAAAIVATVIALRHEQESVTTFLVNVSFAMGLVVVGRVITTWLIGFSRRRRVTAHRVVLIGGGPLAAELAHILRGNPSYGLLPVGFVDDDRHCVAEVVLPHLGTTFSLDAAVLRERADVLLVADGGFAERDLLDIVRTPVCHPCDLLVVPRMHHFHTQTGIADHIGSIPVMRIRTPNLSGPARMIKRVFDVSVAAVLLLAVLPVIAVCALAVRIEGGSGVIFRQVRVGRDGKYFSCLKLRSMRPSDDGDAAAAWSSAIRQRTGPVGAFLRRTSLDELPQLWNILRGDMTLVGPRPERPHFVEQFSAKYDRYAHRHRVQAGLTGLAQVSGLRGDTSIADRARFDNYYIEHWTLWLDIKIILRTISEVVFAKGR
ncbi:sugar transferase [Pseudonocardia charpentierae]|uniref:Sugar transferase n=1 Tax=Pseudonocardia charpentierae TaxID=3075545 RepID=A0ABU2NKH1_9PSEU|nr:sugar transferase [Pseudonocardia sp. DSM 45834]MDT0353498.1 sugar transferase [Pseudonocardia sp. DSM 45834]